MLWFCTISFRMITMIVIAAFCSAQMIVLRYLINAISYWKNYEDFKHYNFK
jgi:hypothetical protein